MTTTLSDSHALSESDDLTGQATGQAAIYPALGAVMKACGPIAKESYNQGQRFNFRGIDAVMNALHPLLAEHGVLVLPEVVDHQMTERETQRGGTMFHHFTRVRFHFAAAADGSRVTVEMCGEAADAGDKGLNKTMSMALKYALFQVFMIPTQDQDADAESPELAAGNRRGETRGRGETGKRREGDPEVGLAAMERMMTKELEGPVNRFLIASLGWLDKGQSWRDLPPERVRQVMTRADAFLEKVKAFDAAPQGVSELELPKGKDTK